MKKIFIKVFLGIMLFGGVYSVGLAFTPIKFNLNPNGQSELKPNIPKEKINFENGLENDPALKYKFRALKQVNELLDSLNGAIAKINNTKYFFSYEKESMAKVLRRERRRAEKIKKEIEKDHNFDRDKHKDFFLGLIDFLNSTSNEVPKAIGTGQVVRCQRVLAKFDKTIEKIESYISTVEDIDGNFDVSAAQDKVKKAKVKLDGTRANLSEINKALEKMDGHAGADQAKKCFQKIDAELKSGYKNIAEAKVLAKESLKELEKVTGK